MDLPKREQLNQITKLVSPHSNVQTYEALTQLHLRARVVELALLARQDGGLIELPTKEQLDQITKLVSPNSTVQTYEALTELHLRACVLELALKAIRRALVP